MGASCPSISSPLRCEQEALTVCDCPELARLGEAVRQGCVAVVVVSSLDGLARDRAQSAILVEEFKAAGVTIETAGE
jgi:DNA invertase Pin-like site-specific DNA recombinase